MKKAIPLLLALLVSTSVAAAEIPLAGSYGTATGCALANATVPVPDGKVRAVTSAKILEDDAICPVTEVGEGVVEGDVTTWQVTIICEAGHDTAVAGTLSVAEDAKQSQVKVAVIDGEGPKGTYKACPTN